MTQVQQLIFDIKYQENYDLDAFVVTQSNKEAFEAIKLYPLGYKPFENILLLYGGKLSGKTYFGKIWQNTMRQNNLNVENISFINSNNNNVINENFSNSALANVFSKIKNTNCFLDNINLIEEKDLFFILETMINANQQYLLTTSAWPMKIKLPDLASRINSIKKIDILTPDLIALKAMIVKYFQDRDVNIKLNTLNYLTYRMPSDFEQIRVILDNINQQSLISKSDISIPFLQKFYSENLEPKSEYWESR